MYLPIPILCLVFPSADFSSVAGWERNPLPPMLFISLFSLGVGRSLRNRADWANEFYPPGSLCARGLTFDNRGAYLAHLPRSFIARYVGMRGRVPRILPRATDQGSATRVLAIFGFRFSWLEDSQGSRRSCRARAISWSSHIRLNPLSPVWTSRLPPLLVSVGQAVCGLLGRAPGDSAFSVNGGSFMSPSGVPPRAGRHGGWAKLPSKRWSGGGSLRSAVSRAIALIFC